MLAYEKFVNVSGEEELVNTNILNTIIKLPVLSGSQKSSGFFEALDSTQNMALYKSDLVKYYIKYKWDRLWLLILAQNLLLWSNIPLLVMLIFNFKQNPYLIWAFICINAFLAVLEVLQLISVGLFKYYGGCDAGSTLVTIKFLTLLCLFYFEDYSILLYIVFTLCNSTPNSELCPVSCVFSGIFSVLLFQFWFGFG